MSHKVAKEARRRDRQARAEEFNSYISAAVKELRHRMAVSIKTRRPAMPDVNLPCATCAFRASTDHMVGADTTAITLLAALMDRKPFYCHEDPRTGEPFPTINGGYAVPQALAMGAPVNLCAGALALNEHSPDDIADMLLDIIAGRSIPRPIPQTARDRIKEGIISIIRKEVHHGN